jgi:hypothetical protein
MDLNQLFELLNTNTVFGGLFVYLFYYTITTAKERENKLMVFLNDMREEFSKLSANFGHIEKDVDEIKKKLDAS